jgi:predicted nucleic acid-binding protein
VDLIMSSYAISEALRNLQNKRAQAVETALGLLDGIAFVEEPPQALADRVRHLVPDPKDVPILAGAVWAEADLLITGNSKDFGKLYGQSVGGCTIVRPRIALDLLLQEIGN